MPGPDLGLSVLPYNLWKQKVSTGLERPRRIPSRSVSVYNGKIFAPLWMPETRTQNQRLPCAFIYKMVTANLTPEPSSHSRVGFKIIRIPVGGLSLPPGTECIADT